MSGSEIIGPLAVAIGGGSALAKAPLQAIVMPVSKAIGKFFEEDFNTWVKSERERRQANLNAHLNRADKDRFEGVEEKPEFFDWAMNASAVDPDDKELSDVWLAVLLAIQNRDPMKLRLTNLAKIINPDEAATFLNSYGRRISSFSGHDSYYDLRLRQLGLSESYWSKFNIFSLPKYKLRPLEYVTYSISYVTLYTSFLFLADGAINFLIEPHNPSVSFTNAHALGYYILNTVERSPNIYGSIFLLIASLIFLSTSRRPLTRFGTYLITLITKSIPKQATPHDLQSNPKEAV